MALRRSNVVAMAVIVSVIFHIEKCISDINRQSFPEGKIVDNTNADVAVDQYHRYECTVLVVEEIEGLGGGEVEGERVVSGGSGRLESEGDPKVEEIDEENEKDVVWCWVISV
ncbi:hypothetical protein V8G54_014882 [Vigna mungo]|uniref:Uncharacterized protein n=1 Tax=Vigna mungo TaxID=3915 RepID=A0AAQ3RXV6_VIGMU